MSSKCIRIGDITIECLPPKDKLVQVDTDSRPYLRAVEHLGRMLIPGTWALAGGLVVPISVGGFYRRHMDIDIVMPLARLCDVMGSFRTHGYDLYTSWSVSHRSRGILLQCRLRSHAGLARIGPRRLYVKPMYPGNDEPLLGKIDLYPYHERGLHLETCNGRQLLPNRITHCSLREAFDWPVRVRCLSLENVATLKASRSGAKHRLDCVVIRDGPDAAPEWFRKHAAERPLLAGQPTMGAAP